jgi:PHD/YefM family antitoxin component YafN of YafNO toxin-antitoxin module
MKAQAERYLVDSKGRKKAVILSLEQYEKLQEDIHDLAVIAERRNEKAVSIEDMKRRLKKDGRV